MNKSLKMWLILLALEITLYFLDKNLKILMSLGVISIYAMLFFVKEILSESGDESILFYGIIPITTIYLFFSGINIWLIFLYIILGVLDYPFKDKNNSEAESGDMLIIITVLFTWMSRDISLEYKIIAPIILIIFYLILFTDKTQEKTSESRQVVYIEGHKYYIPQCKECGSYNTTSINMNELSTSYGRTEVYTETRLTRDVVVGKRQRYTNYELEYKCENCGTTASTILQVRDIEYV
ncbi:hypothetical protein P7M47_09630 [Bisgaard Taxon 10/6]|uniref:hypothetical protein n=1 Tax=Exercitatus varius TaxID=67857 RepID=UPI00294B2CFA|nr:hypothetical protein [Exercitatus varius]MDG2916230.1 hypothetical protein [Exercitatus varius]